jgi:hypothetical protein
MSINSIRQAPDFNQAQYDSLIRQAEQEKVDAGLVDSLLLEAVRGGKNFTQALRMVKQDLPKLPDPTGAAMAQLKLWPALPSPGALIMSVTTQYAAEQRRQNQEVIWAETEAIAQSMKDGASKMREAAVTQLVMGVVSGAISIGMGAAAAKNAAASANEAAVKAGNAAINAGRSGADAWIAATDAMSNASSKVMTAANATIGAMGQIGGGIAGIVGAAGQYVSQAAQAACKEMEADQEKMRAVRDSMKSLNDALRDLIQKSLAAQNDIQSSSNQARTRILA